MSTTPLSRRALVRGAAWTLPTALAATAAPAVAASAACPSTAAIDALFAARQQEVSAYDGCAGTTRPTFTIWYDGPGGVNGYLQNANINVRNQNLCAIDTTAYPLAFSVDIVNLSGPDRNPGGATTLQRSITATNSDGYLSPLSRPGVRTSGVKTESTWEAVGSETVAGASRTVHSARWNVVSACSVNAGEDIDLQISWADGRTSSGRLTDAVRLVPLGMAAPQWGGGHRRLLGRVRERLRARRRESAAVVRERRRVQPEHPLGGRALRHHDPVLDDLRVHPHADLLRHGPLVERGEGLHPHARRDLLTLPLIPAPRPAAARRHAGGR
ncbi:hypothetical protein C1N80_00840 [Brachybacterium sp. SGAir0954]|uniref:hypothetical protein n=1 Tax=Brachybacterium sp. SGAir0954 TaxID=2571029 RepID=UPI0010CD2EAA|nr:hypothetical protein [Brachybacterium sp. SGAir0954]QCR52267.1 hypothetical protein C1N80_00840 [Brachybacterium sp. SGAir0954]